MSQKNHLPLATTDNGTRKRKTLMTASGNNEGILPPIPIKVDGIICPALIDTGVGSSCAWYLEHARIKTESKPLIGRDGELVAKKKNKTWMISNVARPRI